MVCHAPKVVHRVGVENEMNSNNQTGSLKFFGTLYWFVIHTKPRDEHRVKTHFKGMEIETLLPLCENFRYSHGQDVPSNHSSLSKLPLRQTRPRTPLL